MSTEPEKKQSRFSLTRQFTGRELSPEERRSVLEDLFVFGKAHQTPFLIRMTVLLVLSTVIATAGLLSDSAAVVIGAMLVAPLMNPVMAAAGAVVMGWPKRFYSAIWLVGAMGLGALLLSSLLTLVSPELVFIPEQVLARTRPTYYDLLIALAAGSAGAYVITRKESSAIPGVAVAVALLPPLASAGILFTSGEFELGFRAVVLFLTNLVAMVLIGALTFMAVGVAPVKQRARSAAFIKAKIWLFSILTLAICVPLWFYSDKVLFNPHYLAAKSELLQEWLGENQLELVDINMFKENRTIVLHLQGPVQPVNIDRLYERFAAQLEARGETEPFVLEYTWTQKITGQWPVPESSLDEVAAQRSESSGQIVMRTWRWTATQYAAGKTATPPQNDEYTIILMEEGEIEINAACGTYKGVASYSAQAVAFTIKPRRFSKCKDDATLQLFISDLRHARDAFVDNNQFRITLANNAGVMYFEAVEE